MPRRREVPKRETLPDPVYSSTLITKFISCMMVSGKKSVAESNFYGALDTIKDRAKDDPVKVFKKAMDAVRPVLEVKSRRVGGATYQVPVEVAPDRGIFLAMTWLIDSARARKGKAMREKLADELAEAFQGQGNTIKKREDTHKMAEANRAFAHYRW